MTVTTGLQARDLACLRGERLLFKQLTLDLQPGQILQIEGPNGAGKTSLLRILAGLMQPWEGEVFYAGQSIQRERSRFLSDLAWLGHHSGIKADLSPRENLRFTQTLLGTRDDHAIDHALSIVGLSAHAEQPCRQLSAGQNRRAALARLILSPAPLWILDEPFTALDRIAITELEARFVAHAAQGGMIVLTTHQPLQAVPDLQRLDLAEFAARSTRAAA
ncbi:MAG: cytochrome c biogenesis heme-transporting ATPase CcmA [Gammaproteobacteria bacterium]